jgi:hypothetical protein
MIANIGYAVTIAHYASALLRQSLIGVIVLPVALRAEAASIVEEARRQAGQILADARARAGQIDGGGGAEPGAG